MKRLILAAALALGLAAPAAAQTDTTFRATPSHLAAADELLGLMDVERSFLIGLEMALEQETANNPEVAPFSDVLREFVSRYLSWKDLKGEFMQLYVQTYSEDEIRGLITFYRTPLGQTVIKKEPELMARASLIGQRRMQEHMPELMQMMVERMGGVGPEFPEEPTTGTGTGKPATPTQPSRP